MISDVEHIFLYLWAICLSSSEKCLFSFSAGDIRDTGLILGSGGSPGGGHDNPLQYSCLENPHGQRSLEGYSPLGYKELDTTKET